MRALSILIVLVLAVLAIFTWSGRPRGAGAATSADAASQQSPAEPTRLDSVDAAPSRERVDVATAVASPAAGSPQANSTAPDAAGPRCRVHGRVTSQDGGPIPDIEVSLYSVGGPWSTREKLPTVEGSGRSSAALRTKTAADGTFEFMAPVPTADWVTLDTTPSDYLGLADRNFGPAGGRNQPRLVEGDNDVGNLVLASCGAISGNVRSADGTPLTGAVVSAPVAAPGRITNSFVDPAGRFVLGHLPPGTTTFEVTKEGWVSSNGNSAEVRIGQTTRVEDIVLARAAEISGVVVDQRGLPAAKVRIHGWPQKGGHGAGATTRDDGSFTVYLPQTEPYSFEINRTKEFEPWGGNRGAAECTFAPGSNDVRIVLTRVPQVTFHVVDSVSRSPIEAFGIAVDDKLPPGMSRPRFTRGNDPALHPGGTAAMPASTAKHDVMVQADGYAPYEGPIVLDPGSGDAATIALERESSLRGRLVRGTTPVAKATLTLQRDSMQEDGTPYKMLGAMGSHLHSDVGDFAGRSRSVASDGAGGFEFAGLPPGTYALTVSGAGVAGQSWRALVVPKGDVLDVGQLLLTAEAVLRGRLLTPAGVSPIGYTVTLDGEGRPEVTISRADGTFEFTGLAARTHVVNWSRAGERGLIFQPRSPRAIDVVLAAGEVRELTIDTTAFAPATVRVRVLRAERPAVGVSVRGELHDRGNTKNRVFTRSSPRVDAEGWAQLEIDGCSHFDLVVVGAEEGPPLAVLPNLDAVAGSTMEFVVEIQSGILALTLPEALSRPADTWSLRVVLARPEQKDLYAYASAARAPASGFGVRAWTGARVELGEFPVGSYEATVNFQRAEEGTTQQNRSRQVPLREPYTTSVTIENGGTTVIEVP